MVKKFLFLCVLMSFGCVTTFTDWQHVNEFEEVALSYKSAISWSDFKKAGSFMSKQNPINEQALPDRNFSKKIKITSYEVQYLKMNNEKSKIEQTVEIKYYNKDYLIEKVVVDNQIWIYESNSWRLTTGLPVF